jgi:SagB-type dehydrogenase family enzyme
MSIRKHAFFLDWRTQPKNYKTYPNFQARFKIDDYKELEGLNLVGGITLEREYPDGKYYLRTVPSAGGLFPFELYLQIRGINGLINGIYHYEPHERTLCLIHELSNDGVEFYYDNKQENKGLLFLISTVYFRSSWKYRDRSIRYILLDAGHQLGALYAAMRYMDRAFEIDFDFDKLALNEKFGFREDEMFIVSGKSSYKTEKEIKDLSLDLPYIAGCDYLESNDFVYEAYKQSAQFSDGIIDKFDFF